MNDDIIENKIIYTLIGLSNKIKSHTFTITEKNSSIGRSNDNNISIDDSSLSRFHATLSINNSKLVIKDLNSSNGIFINDKKVQRGVLKDNDILGIGKIKFKIQIEVPMLEEPTEKRKKKNNTFFFALISIITCVFFISIFSLKFKLSKIDYKDNQKLVFTEYKETIESSFVLAKKYIEQERWTGAITYLETILTLYPVHIEANKMLRQTKRILKDKESIELIKIALSQKNYQNALFFLNRMSNDSYYEVNKNHLRKKYNKLITIKELKNAQKFCSKKKWKLCHTHIIKHLNHKPKSDIGIQLLQKTEKILTKKNIPYIPWY